MGHRSILRTYAVITSVVVALLLAASPAFAQFTPRTVSNVATGEKYHIEGSVGLWWPSADMSITSAGSGALSGIPGTTIDFKKDLGLTDQRFKEVHLVLRPGRRHKLRFQYIPINYTQGPTIVSRDITPGDNCNGIVFNGICYPVNLPVNSSLDWKAYRFTYEYDFLTHDTWFAGFMLDAKYTDVKARLQSPVNNEFAHARAPIPTIGGIVRFYPISNASITAELSGFRIPSSVSKEYNAHYADFDMYATYNVTNNFGAQIGYRTFDVAYLVKKDSGAFTVKGVYLGVVARY